MMNKLRSLKFLVTFTRGKLSLDICASRLQSGNDVYDGIADSLEEIVDLLNSEGGWTAYGWGGGLCLLNYDILLGKYTKEPGNNKVFYQEISTHIVNLRSSEKYYLGLWKTHVRSLDNLKFDFSSL